MDLHGIVSGAIGAVNPHVSGTVKVSSGYATAGDGARKSAYTTFTDVQMQVQPLSTGDLKLVDSLNIQGELRAIYLEGECAGLVRAREKGGDLIVLTAAPNAGTWLVSAVPEQWADWAHVIATLQNSP